MANGAFMGRYWPLPDLMKQIVEMLTGASDGEKCRWLAYALIAVFGAGISFVAVARIGHGAGLSHAMSIYEQWIVVAGAIGAAAGLYLARDRFGWPGTQGAIRALRGGLIATVTGPVVAGTLALPLYGTMFGPFTFLVMLAGAPILALLWVLNLSAIHVLFRAWRRERNTIFGETPDAPQGRQPRMGRLARGRA